MTIQTKTSRDHVIDIIRGLSIILVVLSHTGNPYGRWFVSYFVQLFFLIAGWLWKDNDTDNLNSAKLFILKNLKRLYFPTIIACIIGVLCNNILVNINFLTTNPAYLATEAGQRYGLAKYYMAGDIVSGIKNSFIMSTPPPPTLGWHIMVCTNTSYCKISIWVD